MTGVNWTKRIILMSHPHLCYTLIGCEWGIRILTCEGGIWPKVYLIELPSIGSSIPGEVLNCLHVIQFPVVVDRMLVWGGRTEWRIDSRFHGGLNKGSFDCQFFFWGTSEEWLLNHI